MSATHPLDVVVRAHEGRNHQISTNRILAFGQRLTDAGRTYLVEGRWATGIDADGPVYRYDLTDTASLAAA